MFILFVKTFYAVNQNFIYNDYNFYTQHRCKIKNKRRRKLKKLVYPQNENEKIISTDKRTDAILADSSVTKVLLANRHYSKIGVI